ncbi:threonine-phosphate decarboxylase, partial [Burkholderia gladioli]
AVSAALADQGWQKATRERLAADGERLAELLRLHGFVVRATPLFCWTDDPRAWALHDALATQGVWTRFFAQAPSLRIGLPGIEEEWLRLEDALDHYAATAAYGAAGR